MDTSGPSHKCQDFVRVALIHRSAWKVNSQKFATSSNAKLRQKSLIQAMRSTQIRCQSSSQGSAPGKEMPPCRW